MLRSILTYGSECWTLTKTSEERLRLFERMVLKRIFGPVNGNETWLIKYNYVIYASFSDVDVVTHILYPDCVGQVITLGWSRTILLENLTY